MTYYLPEPGGEDEFYGVPSPAVGARVVFDIDRLFAARERLSGSPVDRTVVGDEGLVVYEDPLEVLRPPDRLWRVGELEGEIRLAPTNRWIRCAALTVREELPRWLVMGPHGHAVERVMDQAGGLTAEGVRALAAMDPAEEESLVDAVWQRYLRTHQSGSPVGCGLLAVNDRVEEAARRAGDPRLFGWDEEDEVEVLTDPAWQQARRAACAAALALGAPDLLSAEENQRLARRWTAVFGAQP